ARIAFSKFRSTWNEHSQIQELSASDGQIIDEPAIHGCTRLFPVGLHNGLPRENSDRVTRGLFQDEAHIQCLRDLQNDAVLPRSQESRAPCLYLITAEGK